MINCGFVVVLVCDYYGSGNCLPVIYLILNICLPEGFPLNVDKV